MTENLYVTCCASKSTQDSIDYDIVVDQVDPKFNGITEIWREKMEKSRLFFPTEITCIVAIWIEFIRDRIQHLPHATADQFYTETAVFAAEKLKHFSKYGWKCLIMDHPYPDLKCEDSFPQLEDFEKPATETNNLNVTPTLSTDSTVDFISQINFLLNLVASSNLGLYLVKTALDWCFERSCFEMKYPHKFIMPRKYLELLPGDDMSKDIKIKNLLNGNYDEYIIPLHMATEVTDKFWQELEEEL